MKKKTVITMLLAALTMSATAQSNDGMYNLSPAQEDVSQSKNDTVVVNSDSKTNPSFPGGQEALSKYLLKNLKYPSLAEQYDVEGSVVMTFFVDKDGTLKNISAKDCKIERFNTTRFSQETEAKQKKLKEQFALLFAKEGARVIRKMPKWTPATLFGQPVSTKFNLTIRFVDPTK